MKPVFQIFLAIAVCFLLVSGAKVAAATISIGKFTGLANPGETRNRIKSLYSAAFQANPKGSHFKTSKDGNSEWSMFTIKAPDNASVAASDSFVTAMIALQMEGVIADLASFPEPVLEAGVHAVAWEGVTPADEFPTGSLPDGDWTSKASLAWAFFYQEAAFDEIFPDSEVAWVGNADRSPFTIFSGDVYSTDHAFASPPTEAFPGGFDPQTNTQLPGNTTFESASFHSYAAGTILGAPPLQLYGLASGGTIADWQARGTGGTKVTMLDFNDLTQKAIDVGNITSVMRFTDKAFRFKGTSGHWYVVQVKGTYNSEYPIGTDSFGGEVNRIYNGAKTAIEWGIDRQLQVNVNSSPFFYDSRSIMFDGVLANFPPVVRWFAPRMAIEQGDNNNGPLVNRTTGADDAGGVPSTLVTLYKGPSGTWIDQVKYEILAKDPGNPLIAYKGMNAL